jgi:hypothetical protein
VNVPGSGTGLGAVYAELARARMERANLIAAVCAALAAQAEGEDDPLSYLRDQLAEITGRGDAR